MKVFWWENDVVATKVAVSVDYSVFEKDYVMVD